MHINACLEDRYTIEIEGDAANLFSCKAVKILAPSSGKIVFYVTYLYIG